MEPPSRKQRRILKWREKFHLLVEDDSDDVYAWLHNNRLRHGFFFDEDIDPPHNPNAVEPQDPLEVIDIQPANPHYAPLAAFLYHKFISLGVTDVSGQDIAIVDTLMHRTPLDFFETYSIAPLVLEHPLIASVVFGLASRKALLAKPDTAEGQLLGHGMWVDNASGGRSWVSFTAKMSLWAALTHIVSTTENETYAKILLFTARDRFPKLVNTPITIDANTLSTIEHLLTSANIRQEVNEDFIAALIEAQDADRKKNLSTNVLQLTTSLKSIRLTKMVHDRLMVDPSKTRRITEIAAFNRNRMHHLQNQAVQTEEEEREAYARRGINDILEGRRVYVMTKRA